MRSFSGFSRQSEIAPGAGRYLLPLLATAVAALVPFLTGGISPAQLLLCTVVVGDQALRWHGLGGPGLDNVPVRILFAGDCTLRVMFPDRTWGTGRLMVGSRLAGSDFAVLVTHTERGHSMVAVSRSSQSRDAWRRLAVLLKLRPGGTSVTAAR